jgi:hypothetical protein
MNDTEEKRILDQAQKRKDLCDRIIKLAEKYELAKKKSKGFLGFLKKENIFDKPILNGDQEFYDLIGDYSVEELRVAKNIFKIELDELMSEKSSIGFLEGFTCVAVLYSIITINNKYLSWGMLLTLFVLLVMRLNHLSSRFKQRSIVIQANFICGIAEIW